MSWVRFPSPAPFTLASAMRLASLGWLRSPNFARPASFCARANSPRRNLQLSRRKREPFALQRSIHFGLIRLAQRLWCGRERKVACAEPFRDETLGWPDEPAKYVEPAWPQAEMELVVPAVRDPTPRRGVAAVLQQD